MSNPGAESLDARLVRFRSRGSLEDAEPLARALLAAKRPADAAEVAEALTIERPTEARGFALLAEARAADGDRAAAQKAWLEAARRAPNQPEPYVAIADLLLERSDFDRAERIVARGLELAGATAELVRRRDAIAEARRRSPAPAPIASEPTAVVRTSWIPAKPDSPEPERVVREAAPLVAAPVIPPPVVPEVEPRTPSAPAVVAAPPAPAVVAAPPAPAVVAAPPAKVVAPAPAPAVVAAPPAPAVVAAPPAKVVAPAPAPAPAVPPAPVAVATPPVVAAPPAPVPAPAPAPKAPPTPAVVVAPPVTVVAPIPSAPPAPAPAKPPVLAGEPTAVAPKPNPPAPVAPKAALLPPPPADDFDEDGATIVRSLDDMRAELGLPPPPARPSMPAAPATAPAPAPAPARVSVPMPRASVPPARPSSAPGARPSAAPPPPPSAFGFERSVPPPMPDEDDDEGESTIVATGPELVKLRTLGAMLPSTPPTKHVGAPWTDASEENDALPLAPNLAPTKGGDEVDADRPTRPMSASGDDDVHARATKSMPEVRGDATVPYRAETIADLRNQAHAARSSAAEALPTSLDPSTAEATSDVPPDASAAPTETNGASNAPRDPAAPAARDDAPTPLRKLPLVLSGVALVALGSFLAYRWDSNRQAELRYQRLSEALLRAEGASLREAHDAASLLGGLRVAANRDLRLEADLIQALEVGGVGVDVIRGDRVTARARDVSAGWIAAATSAEALLRGDRAAAERALAGTAADARDPRLVYVRALLDARLGPTERARTALAGLASSTTEATAASIALVELDRSLGDDAAARARVVAILRSDADHLRARVLRASLQLDADLPVDAADARALASSLATLGPAEKAWVQATLVRNDAAQERLGDAITQLGRITEPAAPSPMVTLELAAAELALGRVAEARERLVAAFGADPTHARARRLLGRALAALGRGDEALALLGAANDPRSLDARASAALHAAPENARPVIEAIATLGDAAPIALRARALRLRLLAGEDPATLLALAQALHGEQPTDSDVLGALGALASAAGRWDVLSGSVAPEARETPEFAAWLARAAMRRGATDEVESLLRTLEAQRPNSPETAVLRAFVQTERGTLDDALATYTALGDSEGVVLEGAARMVGRVGMTSVLLALGRPGDARAAFDHLSLAERASPVAVVVAARLAILEGRAAAAVDALAPRASLVGATAELLATYGDALFATDAIDRATEVYREAAQLDASLPEAQLGLAMVLVRVERFGEANAQLIRCRRALDARPRGPYAEGLYHTLLGRTLLGRNDVEQARFVLRRAIAQPGAPAEAHFFLGESLAGANSPDARAAYGRYLELAPNGAFSERAQRAIR